MADDSGETLWHAMKVDAALDKVDAGRDGVDREEAQRRKEKFGPNRLPPPKRRSMLRRLLEQFHNVLIYVLIIAAAVTAVLGHWIDMGVILGVVVVNALIGFIQEGKAERALEEIQEMLSRQARVRRDGKRQTIDAEELVPGDIVYLESGDRVPADLRLLDVHNLLVEEAALTGESQGVEKNTEPVGEKAPVGDRYCMAYSSTMVSSGRATGVVVATGADTEIGKINRMMAEAERLTTPLLEEIAQFGRMLTAIILALCAATFAAGYFWRQMDFGEIFLAVVGVAVAAIPEGLPAIITITLAIGVRKMARRRSIIRRLPAVETLGSLTVICADKTGTLTRNEMTAKSVVTADGVYEVSGTGYAPDGEISRHGEKIDLADSAHRTVHETLLAGLLCNDADLHEDEDGWHVDGDPTEGALLPLALKGGLRRQQQEESFPRRDSVPFESERRFMATLHDREGDQPVIFIKGAPETILGMCNRQLAADGEVEVDSEWKQRFEETAANGYRLLAAARKSVPEIPSSFEADDIGKDFVFLGVLGLMDPPREEAIRAVGECQSGGIRVKMITGDYALTAGSIARQLKIGDNKKVLSGHELDEIQDEELAERAVETDVFARSSPEHKIRLVRGLQKKNQIVAMTGDGVNDAPALKQANVGVAMGIKGTEVAKQAAEMVIVDDNFASITEAVRQGRIVYDNIKKSILFMLPTNGGESLVIIVAIVLGLTLPITPVQILWVNMVTAVTLALALAFEGGEAGVMRRPPRAPDQPLLSLFGIWRVAFVSVLILGAVLGLYFWARVDGHSLEYARTQAVNTLVICEIFYLFNTRYILEPTLNWNGLTGSRHALAAVAGVLLLQAVFTYLPQAQFLFGTAALPVTAWLWMAAAGAALFVLVELEKTIVRRFFNNRAGRIRP